MFEILFYVVCTFWIVVAINALKSFVGFAITSILRPTRKNYNTVTK